MLYVLISLVSAVLIIKELYTAFRAHKVSYITGNEKRKEYGKQKMWGSIGFGIFGISAGYLVDVFSEGQLQKDYTCIFYIMLITMIFDIIVSATLKQVYLF